MRRNARLDARDATDGLVSPVVGGRLCVMYGDRQARQHDVLSAKTTLGGLDWRWHQQQNAPPGKRSLCTVLPTPSAPTSACDHIICDERRQGTVSLHANLARHYQCMCPADDFANDQTPQLLHPTLHVSVRPPVSSTRRGRPGSSWNDVTSAWYSTRCVCVRIVLHCDRSRGKGK